MRAKLSLFLGFCCLLLGLAPAAHAGCTASKSCTYGPNISCASGSPTGTCKSGIDSWGWVECDGQKTYCQAPLCQPPQCSNGSHCVQFCTDLYGEGGWWF